MGLLISQRGFDFRFYRYVLSLRPVRKVKKKKKYSVRLATLTASSFFQHVLREDVFALSTLLHFALKPYTTNLGGFPLCLHALVCQLRPTQTQNKLLQQSAIRFFAFQNYSRVKKTTTSERAKLRWGSMPTVHRTIKK